MPYSPVSGNTMVSVGTDTPENPMRRGRPATVAHWISVPVSST
jgi:hypothetical protein